MESKLSEILDGLPEKPPRSCLESFRDFIYELRRRKRTYREIAQILEERCQLRVSKSTVHRFLRARSREKRKSSQPSLVTPMEKVVSEINPPPIPTHSESADEVRRRIEDLKRRSVATDTSTKEFQYDREEPLHLVPKAGGNG
jgi:IS30 family transposase